MKINPIDAFAHEDLVELDPIPTHEDVRKQKRNHERLVPSRRRGQPKIESASTEKKKTPVVKDASDATKESDESLRPNSRTH